MSITDELRKEARGFGRYVYTVPQADCLTAIANRIDAEHEAACAEAYGNGVMSVPIAIDESQWLKLPKDADGVPIHAGDPLDGYGKTIEVVEMRYGRGGWVLISRDGNGYADTFAFTHHHAPTVEDVLREFADEMNQNLGMYTGEAIDADEWRDADAKTVEKFAAKLRLAGDGE